MVVTSYLCVIDVAYSSKEGAANEATYYQASVDGFIAAVTVSLRMRLITRDREFVTGWLQGNEIVAIIIVISLQEQENRFTIPSDYIYMYKSKLVFSFSTQFIRV